MHSIIDGTDSIVAIKLPKIFGESMLSRDKIHSNDDTTMPSAPIAKSSAPFELPFVHLVVIVCIAIVTTLTNMDDCISCAKKLFLVAPRR